MNTRYTEQQLDLVAQDLLHEVGRVFDGGSGKNFFILGLSGDLGAGKTTLTKKIASLLGVEKSVASPTFVFRRDYILPKIDSLGQENIFNQLIHIDGYRLESGVQIKQVFRESELHPELKYLVVLEWPELAEVSLDLLAKIEHLSETERLIVLDYNNGKVQ